MVRIKAKAPLVIAASLVIGLLAWIVWTGQSATRATLEQGGLTADRFVLANGLQVITLPMVGAKAATLMVWYGAGGADDPADRPGLAHYTEHVTFSALGRHSDAEESSSFEREGRMATPGAFTSRDFTAYYHIVPRAKLREALQTEATRLAALIIDDAAVDAERQAVLDERRSDIEQDAHAALEERVQKVAFAHGAYGTPVVAPDAETRRISSSDVRSFVERWYAPNNALLIVAGDVDSADLRTLVQSYFGKIPSRPVPVKERRKPDTHGKGNVSVDAPRGGETLWARTYVAPSFATADSQEIMSLQLLMKVLEDQLSARLSQAAGGQASLKEIMIEYTPDALGQTAFTLHAVLSPTANVDDFERAVDGELSRLASNALSNREIDRARDALKQEWSETWADPFDAASFVGAAVITGRDLRSVLAQYSAIDQIGPEHVRDAAQELFASGASVTGVYAPTR